MEPNLSSGNTLQNNNNNITCYGGFDLHVPFRAQHHPKTHENFPHTIRTTQDQKSTSDDDGLNFLEEPGKAKKTSPWHRVKWTDTMVRILITAVSYITEEEHTKNIPSSQKKGKKWKSISKVMSERGHLVSPQQCEDKFNDLNKKYKRLNEILGRGVSCQVVENPTLLDVLGHVSEKGKEEVRKILSSKHLHYEEMCSYHNGNRLHLPHDHELKCSLHLALGNDHDDDDNDEVQQEGEIDGRDEPDENVMRIKRFRSGEDFSFGNCLDFNKSSDFSTGSGGGTHRGEAQCSNLSNTYFELEEKRMYIRAQKLELEKERFKWERFCRKRDRELEMMKLEIERMKVENERMSLELRRKELGFESN